MSSYTEFKRNAFLDPIKNVVLVDDQFPSYQQLVNKEDVTNATPDKALAIFTHYSNAGKICAVENWENLTSESPDRNLSNLDLLILDYNLSSVDHADSSNARKIICKLAKSPTFNIIIVYTGEGDIQKVALEIAASLRKTDEDSDANDLNLKIDEIQENNSNFKEDINRYITYSIKADFLSNRKLQTTSELFTLVQGSLSGPERVSTKPIVEHLIKARLPDFGRFGVDTTLNVILEKHPIILGQNFLLVVIDKETPPDQFTPILNTSIDIIPINPVQLALQGMLTIANKNGPEYIADVVKNNNLMAGLLLELVKDSDASKLAGRTLQELSARIISDWSSKSGAQFTTELQKSPIAFLKEHASIDLDNSTTKDSVFHELNRHLCTFSNVVSKHLTTGIILHQESSDEYWVVLNCSCDLVPNQNTLKWKIAIPGTQPFTALKLTTRSLIDALKEATSSSYAFIQDCGKNKALRFSNPNDNPHYETFYAENTGRFNEGKLSAKTLVLREKILSTVDVNFRVVAQMRYEYATRFLNMLSAHKSRVGVDFVNME